MSQGRNPSLACCALTRKDEHMAQIIHPHAGFTGSVGPVRFEDGIGQTDDHDVADLLEAEGYEVHHDPRPIEDPETLPVSADAADPLDDEDDDPQE